MLRTAVVASLMLAASAAQAECVCRCVQGQMQALCTNALDLRPLCPPTICPLVPPAIAPIQQPMIPPLGTTSCRQVQVYNPLTRRYEFRTVCQ